MLVRSNTNTVINENNLKTINEELARELTTAIGYDSISQFAEKCRVDSKTLTEIYNRKLITLPNRKLLRKIADNSQNRVTYTRLYDICEYTERDAEEDMSWRDLKPLRGSIYMADLGYTEFGIQSGIRPVYIVQNNVGNERSTSLVVIPLTTKSKNNQCTHVKLTKQDDNMREDSKVICEQITTISKRRLYYNGYHVYLGMVSKEKQLEIQTALEFELGFTPLMFDEEIAFEMLKHIKTLNTVKKYHNSKTMVDILNDKIDEFELYCRKYYKDAKIIKSEFIRFEKECEVSSC